MRNVDLQYWYKTFNRKYFSKKLPKIPVRFKKVAKNCLGETDIYNKTYEPVEIRIHPKLSKSLGTKQCIMTLLHEMCHVSATMKHKRRTGHGPKFRKEIETLFRKGAYTRFNGGLL